MNHLPALLALLLSGSPPALQNNPAEETREVRIFLLDRTTPDRVLKDAAAVLTLERSSGRGDTFLFPRAPKDAAPADAAAPGMIRGLVSTPYYVELNLGEAAPAPRREEATAPPAKAEGAPAPLPAEEVLRRSRKGTWFVRKLPASAFAEPFTATVTLRLGTLSFTSEQFQGPRSGHDTPRDVAARVDRALETLRDRAKDSAAFMDLKPTVDELTRELSKLAPAGFEDASGEVERGRQWCLALTRAMENACYQGDAERIRELSAQFGPRMKDLHARLEPAKEKAPEPVPTPEAPPTVK
jgi:hypothetical protein